MEGRALGVPCFFYEFIAGESLLKYLLSFEPWAEELYIQSARTLQGITWEQVAPVAHRFGSGESAADILQSTYDYFKSNPHPFAEMVYSRLVNTMPDFPEVRFSNGDLYPDNMIIRDRQLVGVIDFENAGFTDPIFEFLLPFFVHPTLRHRGTEERYCERMGFDPRALPWYHGLEYFEVWQWTLKNQRSFVHHTSESLHADLERWLNET
jgi:hypothetical protein